jgi:hypothetical protein
VADVSKLIDDLASPDPQTREDAANKIAAVGTAALEPLRQASRSQIPSIAASAKRIITRIEGADRAPALRRLMAIRELGELNQKEGIAALEPLLKLAEPFVAEYAAEAIDHINGKPFHRAHPADVRADVYLLPQGCRAVGQVLGPPGGPVNMDRELGRMPAAPGFEPGPIAENLQKMLISSAEQIGNVRLDAITVGLAGEITLNSGYAVVIGRGTYDPRAIGEWMHSQQFPSNRVGGVEVFQPPGAESAVFFPDGHHACFIASPHGAAIPLEEVVAAIQRGRGGLNGVAEMKRLVDAAPAGQPLWAVAKITPSYAQAPVFAPFDTIELGSDRQGDSINLQVRARGQQPEKARAAAQMVQDGARQLAANARQALPGMPMLKPFVNATESVRCEATAGNATLTANLKGIQSGLFLLPLLMAHEARPVQPPAAVLPPAPKP